MRRTNEEFKAELEKRCQSYRQERAKKRRTLLSFGACACLCYAVLTFFDPFAANSEAPQAADMQTMGELKTEMSMAQSPECAPEYAMDAAAPMEQEPAEPAAGILRDESAEITVVCGEEEITLDDGDAAVIRAYLSSNDWIMSAANCLCDYTIYVDSSTYRYHSDCGTVQNESGHSLILLEEDKIIFNEIMAKCHMCID